MHGSSVQVAGQEALEHSQLECNQLATLIRVRTQCLLFLDNVKDH